MALWDDTYTAKRWLIPWLSGDHMVAVALEGWLVRRRCVRVTVVCELDAP